MINKFDEKILINLERTDDDLTSKVQTLNYSTGWTAPQGSDNSILCTTEYVKNNLAPVAHFSTENPINPDTDPVSTVWVKVTNEYPREVVDVFFWDSNTNRWDLPVSFKNIIMGAYAIAIQNQKNEYWVAGADDYGELGIAYNATGGNLTNLSNIDSFYNAKGLYLGYMRSFVHKSDDTLWAQGASWDGQLGLGDAIANAGSLLVSTQVPISNVDYMFFTNQWGFYSTFLVKTDGTVWGAGYDYVLGVNGNQYNDVNTFTQIPGLLNPQKFTGNDDLIIVLNGDGKLYAAGRNYGLINNGVPSDLTTFTALPSDFDNPKIFTTSKERNEWVTFIQKSDGTVWGIGNNTQGQLGLGDLVNRLAWTQMPSFSNNCKKILHGYNSTLIHALDDTLWIAGTTDDGHFGLGVTSATYNTWTQIPGLIISELYCSIDDTVVIVKHDGTVWGCGYNYSGQLGLGDKVNRNVFVQIPGMINPNKVILDNECLIIENFDGTTYRCGYNGTGQLGNGTLTDITTLVQYTTII